MKRILATTVGLGLATALLPAQDASNLKGEPEKEVRPAEKVEKSDKPTPRKNRPSSARKKEEQAEDPKSPAQKAPEAKEKKTEATLSSQMDSLRAEKEVLQLLSDLAAARIKEEQAERQEKLEEMKLRTSELEAAAKLADLEAKKDHVDEIAKLKQENELLQAQHQVAKTKADIALAEAKQREGQLLSEMNRLRYEVDLKEKAMVANHYTEGQEATYLHKPLDGRALVLSDRRIPLNGSISMKTADEVCERIHYFNNKSEKYPIFLVIDDSPGGSVMAGYRILMAMEGSEAPVHVVVKSFAASMAAVITTLAEESYCYPNAVLLHHQVSSIGFGNLKEQQEGVEMLEEWWGRLAKPVADKMGISLDEFVEQMYQKASSGDWEEFGDEARKLKWVNHVVDEIRETRILRNPDYTPIRLPSYSTLRKSEAESTSSVLDARAAIHSLENPVGVGLAEELDDQGRPFVQLPRLNPFDAWWLHNPDGYYRAQRR